MHKKTRLQMAREYYRANVYRALGVNTAILLSAFIFQSVTLLIASIAIAMFQAANIREFNALMGVVERLEANKFISSQEIDRMTWNDIRNLYEMGV